MNTYGQIIAQWQAVLAYLSHLKSRGIAAWSDQVDYVEHARVMGSDGEIFVAQEDTGPKTGNVVNPDNENPRMVWELDTPPDIDALTDRVGAVETAQGTADDKIDALTDRVGAVETAQDLVAQAWGYVASDGTFAGPKSGATVTRSGDAGNRIFRLELETALAATKACVPIVTAAGPVDSISFLEKSNAAVEVQFQRGREDGAEVPFQFAIYAGDDDNDYPTPTHFPIALMIENQIITAASSFIRRNKTNSEYDLEWNTSFVVNELRRYYINADGKLAYHSQPVNYNGSGRAGFRVARQGEYHQYIDLVIKMDNIVKPTRSIRDNWETLFGTVVHPEGVYSRHASAPGIGMKRPDFSVSSGNVLSYKSSQIDYYSGDYVRWHTWLPEYLEYEPIVGNGTRWELDVWHYRIRPVEEWQMWRDACEAVYARNRGGFSLGVERLLIPYDDDEHLSSFVGQS